MPFFVIRVKSGKTCNGYLRGWSRCGSAKPALKASSRDWDALRPPNPP